MICCVRAAKAVQTPARYKRKAIKYAAVKGSHDREQNAVFRMRVILKFVCCTHK